MTPELPTGWLEGVRPPAPARIDHADPDPREALYLLALAATEGFTQLEPERVHDRARRIAAALDSHDREV